MSDENSLTKPITKPLEQKSYEESLERCQAMLDYALTTPNRQFPFYKSTSESTSINPIHALRFLLENGWLQEGKGISVIHTEENGEGHICLLYQPPKNKDDVDLLQFLKDGGMLIEKKGRQFVKFQGLLALATMYSDIVSITPEPIMEWCNPEINISFFKSTIVVLKDGIERTYTDYGDTNKHNVGAMVVPHMFRMASTRATVRALKLALGVGLCAIDELIQDED